jgi:hypothetical protein
LPSGVFAPVDLAQGFHCLMALDCLALRSGVQVMLINHLKPSTPINLGTSGVVLWVTNNYLLNIALGIRRGQCLLYCNN